MEGMELQAKKKIRRKRADTKTNNIRASYQDYGITPERLSELVEIAQSGQYDKLVHSAANSADERAAKHIILSVKKNLSYECIEFHDKFGRCPLGRTDFYGAKRLFFHYLDIALRKEEHCKM